MLVESNLWSRVTQASTRVLGTALITCRPVLGLLMRAREARPGARPCDSRWPWPTAYSVRYLHVYAPAG